MSGMLEAIKRKRYMMKEMPMHEPEAETTKDDELAPVSASHEHDALLGNPAKVGKGKLVEDAIQDGEKDNQVAEGMRGFGKDGKPAPDNSHDDFFDTKKDSHDPVDLNEHRNMAGADGESNQMDHMGVHAGKDVRLQSSAMAKHNAMNNEHIKKESRGVVKKAIGINQPDANPGDGLGDGDGPTDEKSGMKLARSRMNGFLSKMRGS